MSQQKGQRGKHAILEHDENCPYCGTTVKKGVSICTGCQAEHTFEPSSPIIRLIIMALFLVSLILCIAIGVNVGGVISAILIFSIVALYIWLLTILGKTDKTTWLRKRFR